MLFHLFFECLMKLRDCLVLSLYEVVLQVQKGKDGRSSFEKAHPPTPSG